MPHVSLPGGVDLFYEARIGDLVRVVAEDDKLELNLDLPTLIILTPIWLDTSYCAPFLEHFSDKFNVIAFDIRSHGRSKGTFDPGYDFFVAAADIAFAMELLQIPPSHFFGSGALSHQIGLKLCLLFPEQVLSFAQASPCQLFSPPEHAQVWGEIVQEWFFPEDEGDFYETMDALSSILLSHHSEDPEREVIKDKMLGSFIRRYSPYDLRDAQQISRINLRHPRVAPEDIKDIHQPIMIMHGTADKCYRPEIVFGEVPTHAPNPVEWHVIEDAPHQMILTHLEPVLDHLSKFLALQSAKGHSSTAVPLDRQRALQAVARLSEHTDGGLTSEEVLKRQGDKPGDYSLATREEREATQADLDKFLASSSNCSLYLPGRNTLDAWDIEETSKSADPDSEEGWTFSKRRLFEDWNSDRRPTISGATEISVSVLADEVEDSLKLSPDLGGRKSPSAQIPMKDRKMKAPSPLRTSSLPLSDAEA